MFQNLYNHMYKNPIISFISGLLSFGLHWARHLLTDEFVLKIVAGVGVWVATIVGILSGIIYLFKTYDVVSLRIKRWREKRSAKILQVVLCLMVILGASCKSRQVNLQKTSTSEHNIWIRTGDSTFYNTGAIHFSDSFKDSLATRDSFDVEILTDTGLIAVDDGKFIGRAKSVKIKGRYQVESKRSGSTNFEDTTNSGGHYIAKDSIKQDKQTTKKKKQVIAKPDHSWSGWVAAALALLLAGLYFFKFRK